MVSRSDRQNLTAALEELEKEAQGYRTTLSETADLRSELNLPEGMTEADMEGRLVHERSVTLKVEQALRVLETLSFNALLTKSLRDFEDAKALVERAEIRLAQARQAERCGMVIHAAARRAVGETLDRRLERIGPLLGELYRRLRPHPVWRDIDYMVRGDVRRFLRLEVGQSLNPQFLFSSGQRRVTGLAFLLSVYLSTSWSRLKSIILDDPVQHIDDFRAVQLAEVLGQLRAQGYQIICAVEDTALADLICRRLSYSPTPDGTRITLGEKDDGTYNVVKESPVTPLPQSVLLPLREVPTRA